MVPAQGQFFQEQFNGEFVVKTFINGNVDNTFLYRQGDVYILVEEEYNRIKLELGGHYPHESTGKVSSKQKMVDYRRPSKNVGEINERKREVLEDLLGSSDDLYEAWINQFGEDSIIKDER